MTDFKITGPVLYMSDIHGEYDTFKHLMTNWRDNIQWTYIIGDVYDRGPSPEKIIELMMEQGNIDLQWGNHDIVWMGAALGQAGCIAHVVRNCARYGNLDILTDAYGMDLDPLFAFAASAYADDPCEAFALKSDPGLSDDDRLLNMRVQKAMAIIQFKVEAALIDAYPEFGLGDRKLLDKVDYEANAIEVDGVVYDMTDTYFPTVDRENPYALTDGERAVVEYLERSFMHCEKLSEHIDYLFKTGSLYKIADGDLLLHACVPLNPDGSLKEANIFGTHCSGKALYDMAQTWVKKAFDSPDPREREMGRDLIWYLWLGPASPLFAKSKMATFEIYLCSDKAARKEIKNPFYTMLDEAAPYDAIFEDFGLDPAHARIICGHTPVKAKDGEDPVKAGGRIICIDGGMSPAYQKTTGLMGYTLVSDQGEMILYAHERFDETGALISEARVLAPR